MPSPDGKRIAFVAERGEDVAIFVVSADGHILGTYLHGMFEEPAACAALLRWAGLSEPQPIDHAAARERTLDHLADVIENSCDLERLLAPLA